MSELTSQWSKSLENNLEKYTVDGFNEHSDLTGEIFKVSDNSSGIIRIHDAGGPSLIPKGTEGAASTLLTTSNGYESVASPQIFKGKMSITEEMIRHVRYPEIMEKAKQLGEAAKYSINLFGYEIFIEAFNTARTFYGDNLPLASTVHTRAGSNTWSNASSTGITLTETNLETGVIALKQQVTHSGRKLALGSGNIVLMVPEALDKEAVIITGSTLRSNTTDNDANWYRGKFNVFVNPFTGSDITDFDGTAGSDTAWYLFGQNEHGLEFVYDQRPMFRNWEDIDSGTLFTKVQFSCKPIWNHPRGFWASKGDGAAYSS